MLRKKKILRTLKFGEKMKGEKSRTNLRENWIALCPCLRVLISKTGRGRATTLRSSGN